MQNNRSMSKERPSKKRAGVMVPVVLIFLWIWMISAVEAKAADGEYIAGSMVSQEDGAKILKKDIFKPYVKTIFLAEADTKAKALKDLKKKGAEFYLDKNLSAADGNYVLLGYDRTGKEKEALRDVLVLSLETYHVDGYEKVSDKAISGGYLYVSAKEKYGNPVNDISFVEDAEVFDVSAKQWISALYFTEDEPRVTISVKRSKNYKELIEKEERYSIAPVYADREVDTGLVLTQNMEGLAEKQELKLQAVGEAGGNAQGSEADGTKEPAEGAKTPADKGKGEIKTPADKGGADIKNSPETGDAETKAPADKGGADAKDSQEDGEAKAKAPADKGGADTKDAAENKEDRSAGEPSEDDPANATGRAADGSAEVYDEVSEGSAAKKEISATGNEEDEPIEEPKDAGTVITSGDSIKSLSALKWVLFAVAACMIPAITLIIRKLLSKKRGVKHDEEENME